MEGDSLDDCYGDDRGSDEVDGHAERGPPPGVGHVVVAVLPQVLQSVADEADDDQPGRPGDACCGEYHECACDGGLDGDDGRATVGDGEADVHRCDQGYGHAVDGGCVEPPEAEWCGGLEDAPEDSPDERCAAAREESLQCR